MLLQIYYIEKSKSYDTIITGIQNSYSPNVNTFFGNGNIANYYNSEVADILVKFLYHVKPSKHKDVLWFCYGGYIVDNLKKNFSLNTKVIQCVDCGEWFEVSSKDNTTCRCSECYYSHRKRYKAEKEKERRDRLRGQSKQLDYITNN